MENTEKLVEALPRGPTGELAVDKLISFNDVYKRAFRLVNRGDLEDYEFDAIINAIESVPPVDLSAVNRATFRLGQMDMQQSAVQMLRDLADSTTGMARTNLRAAAECVEKLHVFKSNTGGDVDG